MPMHRLTACQARAARAMLMWSIRELSEESGISESSVRRIEASYGVPENVSLELLVKMREFFEGRGFIFLWHQQSGPGVHWRRYPPVSDQRVAG